MMLGLPAGRVIHAARLASLAVLALACGQATAVLTPTVPATTPTPLRSGAAPAPTPAASPPATTAHPLLLVANHAGADVAVVDPVTGVIATIPAVESPWGIVLSPDRGTAYVSGARALAVVDLRQRTLTATIPYQTTINRVERGEYREGGMGIDVSPDGRLLFVGLHLRTGPGRLEVIDVAQRRVTASHQVGVRPFQVVAAADSRTAYTLDHDSYSVTVVDATAGAKATLSAAPLGRGAYDKPHYGALDAAGRLLLPYQGRVLQTLDPSTGQSTTRPLRATTHQHGVALTPDGRYLLIVGTGPAGGVNSPPSLTVLDLQGQGERILPLTREHELIAVSPDGVWAYLTGGYLLNGGWNGITLVHLESGVARELPLPGVGQPLGIAVLPLPR